MSGGEDGAAGSVDGDRVGGYTDVDDRRVDSVEVGGAPRVSDGRDTGR